MQEGPAWIVVLHGEHDLSTVSDVARQLDQALAEGTPTVVDLTDVAFMDSAILKTLLAARERALVRRGASFAMVAPLGSFPSRVLALVGPLVPTYPTLADAIAEVTSTK